MRCRTKAQGLIRYIVSISVVGAGFTVLLDMLANGAGPCRPRQRRGVRLYRGGALPRREPKLSRNSAR